MDIDDKMKKVAAKLADDILNGCFAQPDSLLAVERLTGVYRAIKDTQNIPEEPPNLAEPPETESAPKNTRKSG
jgi:hypothetical protein